MYLRFVDNGKLAVLTSARRENGFLPKFKTSTRNRFDFRLPSQKSALFKVPVSSRIEFKIMFIAYKVLHDRAPIYLQNSFRCILRSSNRNLLA